MPFHDLNVPYTGHHADLAHTLAFHAELGYSVVALSLSVTGKLPATPPSIPVAALAVPPSIHQVLTRLTITVSDASQNHRLSALQPHYSLIALRPTTEKAFQLCSNSLECDLISLDLSQRLPFILKFKTVASALQRGVRFEICYSPGVAGGTSDARRNLISGATALIRATRGRGIIISGEARNALGVRGPYDVINLAQVWGLGQERGKEAICEEAAKVVRLAGIKRTSFRGVVDIIQGGGRPAVRPPVATAASQDHTTGKRQVKPVPPSPSEDAPSTGEADRLNGVKRKASTSSVTAGEHPPTTDEKPPSKREMKRRAKKARLEGKESLGTTGSSVPTGTSATAEFSLRHETLS